MKQSETVSQILAVGQKLAKARMISNTLIPDILSGMTGLCQH